MATKDTDIILTEEGKAELEEELNYLENDKREEIGERIRIAREFGDISENSEFDDAKNEQALLEARIAEIRHILASAKVQTAPKSNSGRVNIGSVVTVVDEKGKERVFKIVGATEADSTNGKISNESPLGKALMGKTKGTDIEYAGPTGRQMKFSIIKVGR